MMSVTIDASGKFRVGGSTGQETQVSHYFFIVAHAAISSTFSIPPMPRAYLEQGSRSAVPVIHRRIAQFRRLSI